jgi:hypothetical protein
MLTILFFKIIGMKTTAKINSDDPWDCMNTTLYSDLSQVYDTPPFFASSQRNQNEIFPARTPS